MSKYNKQEVCKSHYFILSRTIDSEEWLAHLAARGLILKRIEGCRCYFSQERPTNLRFFLMNPEPGTNSDSWVFYEFVQKHGKSICCSGPSFLSPSHALTVFQDAPEYDNTIAYYFKYRNYRLSKRFLRNAILAFVLASMCAIMGLVGSPNLLTALFPYLIISILLSAHFLLSFTYFNKKCVMAGYGSPLSKPRRPGY